MQPQQAARVELVTRESFITPGHFVKNVYRSLGSYAID